MARPPAAASLASLQRAISKRRRRIVGLISGTSADGVDAALLEVESRGPAPGPASLEWELLSFVSLPYPDPVRREILAVQQGADRVLERLTRLHFLLGHLFADGVEAAAREAGVPLSTVDLVASHGQTVSHFPAFEAPGPGDGPHVREMHRASPGGDAWQAAATLQIGEPAVIAERTGVTIVSDFRSRDVVGGGTGAPLVPLVDYVLFSDPERGRLALNVGGIANVTALFPGAPLEEVTAFDTGPGNMVVDALVGLLTDGEKHMDEGGAWARKGTPNRAVAEAFLEEPYFLQTPPKAAGREEFGRAFAERVLAACREEGLSPAATVATGTWLTAASVHRAQERFLAPRGRVEEVIVSGGGAHNVALLEYLIDLFDTARVVPSDYYGLDVDAKEAAAFAILGHLTLEGKAGNLPAVTGASHPLLLGSFTPGGEPE